MTVVTLRRPAETAPVPLPASVRTPLHSSRLSRLALLMICALQVAFAMRPGMNATPFEDEGLYVYMGHRMIAHVLHGAFLSEYPGAYFSGAPGFYPVLAAVGDYFGGLQGARTVSLLFALGATVSVNGLGKELYGRRAGLLAATAFVLCGSVMYQSDLATFDSTTLCLVAAAAWLTVYSVRHDRFLWAPVVAVLLVLAFYAKYAGAVYVPVVAALAVVVAARADRLLVLRRAVFMLGATVTIAYFVYAIWGQSLGPGIAVTTTSRAIIDPASRVSLLHQVLLWVGPWLALAVVGSLLTRRSWATSAVLLGASIVAPLQQIRIGESTSLAKHVAFGMIFATPLIGLLIDRMLRRHLIITLPVSLLVALGLGASGLHYSHVFMTDWVTDQALLAPLQRLITATPGKPILGDQPSPERYALRGTTAPLQWTDTYAFSYDHKSGPAAYQEAIDQTSFGVIYLAKQPYVRAHDGSPTSNSEFVYHYLTTTRTPYQLAGQVPRLVHGQVVGQWSLFIPKAVHLP